jgi:hypothetical protein
MRTPVHVTVLLKLGKIVNMKMYKVTDWDKDLSRVRPVLSSERAPHSDKHCNGPKNVVQPEEGNDTKMERPTDWPSVALWRGTARSNSPHIHGLVKIVGNHLP